MHTWIDMWHVSTSWMCVNLFIFFLDNKDIEHTFEWSSGNPTLPKLYYLNVIKRIYVFLIGPTMCKMINIWEVLDSDSN